MRYGILSDIHGNLPALRAALTALRSAGVDRFLCAGDLVGYGPQPNECVDLVASLEMPCVAGNHDRIAIGELSDERCIRLARESLRWTRAELRADAQTYLRALPTSLTVEGGGVLAHGSLDDPQCYVTRAETARGQMAALRERHPNAWFLVLGHTHRAWLWSDEAESQAFSLDQPTALPGGPYLLNPGSVGQSRERTIRARCLVLDVDRREATYLALPYEYDLCRRELHRRGLPRNSCHLYPSVLERSASVLKRVAKTVIGRM